MKINYLTQREVLEIINRSDSTTIWDWSQKKGWFPQANIQGRRQDKPWWTFSTIQRWIEEGIPKMFEAGAKLPEFIGEGSPAPYQEQCMARMRRILEKKEKQRSIVKVYRLVPKAS